MRGGAYVVSAAESWGGVSVSIVGSEEGQAYRNARRAASEVTGMNTLPVT
jgi:hypothetical protein